MGAEVDQVLEYLRQVLEALPSDERAGELARIAERTALLDPRGRPASPRGPTAVFRWVPRPAQQRAYPWDCPTCGDTLEQPQECCGCSGCCPDGGCPECLPEAGEGAPVTALCEVCNASFRPSRTGHTTCSGRCRVRKHRNGGASAEELRRIRADVRDFLQRHGHGHPLEPPLTPEQVAEHVRRTAEIT